MASKKPKSLAKKVVSKKTKAKLPFIKSKSSPPSKPSSEGGWADAFRGIGAALANYATGKREQIGKSRPKIAAPEKKETGLNVESAPKPAPIRGSQEKSILDKQNKRLDEIVAGSRKEQGIQDTKKGNENEAFKSMKESTPKKSKDFSSAMSEAKTKAKQVKDLSGFAKSFPGTKVDPESIKNKQAHEKLISGMTQAEKLKNPYSGRTAVGSKYKHEQGIKESANRKNEADYNKALEDAQKGATIKKDIGALKGFVKKAQSTSRANKITEDNKSRSKEELVNPYSGRTKEKSFLKHTQATGKEIPKGSKRYNQKNPDPETIDFGTPKVVSASPSSGSKAPLPPSQNAPRPKAPPAGTVPGPKAPPIPSGLKAPPIPAGTKAPSIPAGIKAPVPPSSKTKQAPLPKTNTASSQPKNYTQPSKPKTATAPPAPKPTQASDRKPSMAGGIAKAAATHIGMALMHGTNYPRVMAQHAAQGPREFKPGWHGFTSPVEKPKAEEATDTKGERG